MSSRDDAPYVQLKVTVGKSLEASLARLRKKLQEKEEKRKEETSKVDGTGCFSCRLTVVSIFLSAKCFWCNILCKNIFVLDTSNNNIIMTDKRRHV